jgi:putative ABC transport system permease protein
MAEILQNVRYALRQLRKSPGFVCVAVVTLALGIGANTAIYGVVNAVLLRALPYKSSDQLALIWSTDKKTFNNRDQFSFTDIEEYRARNHTLEDIVAFGDWNAVFGGNESSASPERIPGMQVGDGYFSLMRVQPLLGRGFLPEEEIEGKDQVVVLGFGLWQRRFASDPSVIGRKIALSGRPYTVVGVLPKDFPFLPASLVDGPAQFYRPVAEKYDRSGALSRHLRALTRLKPGVSLVQVQADLDVINRSLAAQWNPGGFAKGGHQRKSASGPASHAGRSWISAVDCMREHCQPAAFEIRGAKAGDRRTRGSGRESRSINPAGDDGKFLACPVR